MSPAFASSLVAAISETYSNGRLGDNDEREHFALLAARNGVAYPGHDVVGTNGMSYDLNRQHEQWASALLSAKTQFRWDGKFDSAAFKVYLATKLTSLAGAGKLGRDGKLAFSGQAIEGFVNLLYFARELGMVGDDYLSGGKFSLISDVEEMVRVWKNNYEPSADSGNTVSQSVEADERKRIAEAADKSNSLALTLRDKMLTYRVSGNAPHGLGSTKNVGDFLAQKGISKFGQNDVI